MFVTGYRRRAAVADAEHIKIISLAVGIAEGTVSWNTPGIGDRFPT
ncbi:hypothetical protein [Bradyrhizobium icense]|nr:hypothetical protein [Bradyrhizobium icense]